MTDRKHTPGPRALRIQEQNSKRLPRYMVHEQTDSAHLSGKVVAFFHSEDDARLFVAAPELLAALERLIDAGTGESTRAQWNQALAEAVDAIARVKEESK